MRFLFFLSIFVFAAYSADFTTHIADQYAYEVPAIATYPAGLASTTSLLHLSNTGISAAKVDSAGNIYLAGLQGEDSIADSDDAYVAKLSPDGSKILYAIKLGGSKYDSAFAIDVDSTGAAYILGQTQSPDFPVTSGVLQSKFLAGSMQGFVAKIDPSGRVVYATLIGNSSDIYPSSGGIVVDSAGEVIVSGQTTGTDFPSTAGAPFASQDENTSFIAKLDTSGAKLLVNIRGIGGILASDGQGHIYIAGLADPEPMAIPTTPGAFQSTHAEIACGGTFQIAFGCFYQYVTKLDAGLTQIIFSTYVTGSYGAAPSALSVDAKGNVLLAGSTQSSDYPTTANAFEPYYIANNPPPVNDCLPDGCLAAPAESGYVTELNNTGTGLVFSTFFSGTLTDTIEFAAFTTNGIYLSGQARSADLPGFDGVPTACLPQTFLARLSSDGTSIASTRIPPGSPLLFDSFTNTLLVRTDTDILSYDPSTASPAVMCILDAADLRPVTSIAPGELLSIFGPRLVNEINSQEPGAFGPTLSGVEVTTNGIASPLLYVSPQQINIQVPFEIAGATTANIVLTSSEVNASDARAIQVVDRNPVAFLDTSGLPSGPACLAAGVVLGGNLPYPLALNEDGSQNSCLNPASAGSLVRVFLAGLGLTMPPQATGSMNGSPGILLNLPITLDPPVATVESATALPGSIAGVWQVGLRIPINQSEPVAVTLLVDSVPVRDSNLILWVRK